MKPQNKIKEKHYVFWAETRALIGGGGGGAGRVTIHIFVFCPRLIPFEMNLKATDCKRNSSGRTRIYKYLPPPPPINAPASFGPLCIICQVQPSVVRFIVLL